MSGFTAQPDELQLVTRQIQLELQEVGASVRSTAELSSFEDPLGYLMGLGKSLAFRLKAYVLTQHLVGDTYETTVTKDVTLSALDREPASWFQHFKRDHLPTIAKWRPVRYRVTTREVTGPVTVPIKVKFDRYAAFPHADVAIRDDRLGAPVLWERVTQL